MAPKNQLQSLAPLTLGTVQLGIDYGIANTVGQPAEHEAFSILSHAIHSGITTIDTARAYGSSEAVIGRWLRQYDSPNRPLIVTKIRAAGDGPPAERLIAAQTSLVQSREALGCDYLDLVLVHREGDLLDDGIYEFLLEQKARGLIGGIGASLYSPDVGHAILESRDIDALQVPFSAADRRFEDARVLESALNKHVRVFGRSAFMQGALLMPPHSLPSHLASLRAPLMRLQELAESQSMTPAELLLLFAMGSPGISSVVIGVDNAQQLATHAKTHTYPPLAPQLYTDMRALFSGLAPDVIDPSKWPR